MLVHDQGRVPVHTAPLLPHVRGDDLPCLSRVLPVLCGFRLTGHGTPHGSRGHRKNVISCSTNLYPAAHVSSKETTYVYKEGNGGLLWVNLLV